MQRVDFYKLSRPVQERFLGSVRGSGMPVPILELRVGPREPLVWCGVAAAGLLALFVLYGIGYGSLTSAIAIHPAGMVVLYALFASTAAFGLLRALAVWREVRTLPWAVGYRSGVFVFPIGVVDARRHEMVLYEMHELTSAEGPTPAGTFVLTFKSGERFEFPVKDAARAEQAKRALDAARAQHLEASQARESIRPKALAAIDPLQDGGFASPLVPKTPIARTVPFWAARSYVVAPAIGVLVAIGVWNLRNWSSDQAMYLTATEANDIDSWRAYLLRGSRHAEEVQLVHMPRAELKKAVAAGTVDAIEGYIAAHPKTKIGPEIAAARRTAMLADLAQTKQAGTLTALKDFVKRHPDHHLEGELAVATHAVYVAALEKYKAVANPKDTLALATVEKVLAYFERTKTNKLLVRVQRKIGKTLERSDQAVGKSPAFMGGQSFPTRYFDAAHAKPREADLIKTIAARFAEVFPADVLTVEAGDSIEDPEAPLPLPTAPTLFVVHQTEWGGGASRNDNPRGVFVGVGELFDAELRIPEDPKPSFKLHLTGWRGPNLSNLKGEEHPEERVYATMAKDIFDQFTKKLLGSFFKDALPAAHADEGAAPAPPRADDAAAHAP